MPIHRKHPRFPFGGLEFFQCSSNETLQKRLEREIKRSARMYDCNYTFYSMTCYISQAGVSSVTSLLNAELGGRLSGFNILFDQDEFIKQGNQISTIFESVWVKNNLPESSINILPVNTEGGLFHAKAYALLPEDFEVFDCYRAIEKEDYQNNSYLRRNYEISDKLFLGIKSEKKPTNI